MRSKPVEQRSRTHRHATKWRFITNHAAVLLCIAANPDSLVKDIAKSTGITERAAQSILRDLEEAGFVEASRIGRRNSYKVHPNLPMRHPFVRRHNIGDLLVALAKEDDIDLGCVPSSES